VQLSSDQVHLTGALTQLLPPVPSHTDASNASTPHVIGILLQQEMAKSYGEYFRLQLLMGVSG
jgi:hypothetical protein